MTGQAAQAEDLTPAEALEVLRSRPDAVLVDVRTPMEWERVGVPDLGAVGAEPVFLEWLVPPTMTPNPDFVGDLKTALAARNVPGDAPLLFLCRSGARSAAAASAMAGEGYARCHNIAGGFEGAPARGLDGWRDAGLPWKLG